MITDGGVGGWQRRGGSSSCFDGRREKGVDEEREWGGGDCGGGLKASWWDVRKRQ